MRLRVENVHQKVLVSHCSATYVALLRARVRRPSNRTGNTDRSRSVPCSPPPRTQVRRTKTRRQLSHHIAFFTTRRCPLQLIVARDLVRFDPDPFILSLLTSHTLASEEYQTRGCLLWCEPFYLDACSSSTNIFDGLSVLLKCNRCRALVRSSFNGMKGQLPTLVTDAAPCWHACFKLGFGST